MLEQTQNINVDSNIINISVLGAGAWGTALANAFAHHHNVSLWLRDENLLNSLNHGYNQKYLPNIKLNNNLKFSLNFDACINSSDVIIIATPSKTFADIASEISRIIQDKKYTNKYIVWLCKGFINFEGITYLPHQLIQKVLPDYAKLGVLTGPSFAQEVAIGLPCALTAASKSVEWLEFIQHNLHQPNLRIYTNDDVIGCEIGGALKNVLAVATGVASGLELGLNAQAALITRGVSEMMRLGTCLGANAQTLMGLSGLGDLILTATGDLSRNRTVGLHLGKGEDLDSILANLGHVAEGINSTKLVYEIARKHGIYTPIVDAVYDIVFNKNKPKDVLYKLLAREAKPELV
jgi:glycerol-3-phosphate dehydrogenase (NAD(P)+)